MRRSHGLPRPDKCVAFEFWPALAKTSLPSIATSRMRVAATLSQRGLRAHSPSSVGTLGALSAVLGRARPELRPDIRSFPFRNYIILLRYIEKTIEIINVIESHRDLDAIFRKD